MRIIKWEEGFKSKPYYCSEGYPTIGYGTKLGPKGAPLSYYQIEVTIPIAEMFLEDSINRIYGYLLDEFNLDEMGPIREQILVSMCYQLGIQNFKEFRKTIAYIKDKNWEAASYEMLDSLWSRKQTPERAERHSQCFRENNLDAYKDYV